MKFCFVGVGSIAIKHIKNLRELDDKIIIHALRSNKSNFNDIIPSLVDKQIYNLLDLDDSYDGVFICNPTSIHIKTLIKMKYKSKNFFIEKPVSDKALSEIQIEKLKNLNIYVACPLRYNVVIEKIKEIVEQKGNPINARIICSSYLPNWRAEDYRKTYSAKKELGGGVDIDLIHEVDYMAYLFGMPKSKYTKKGTFSNLEINSNDLTVHIFDYEKFLVEMHLDYFGFKRQRYIELFYNDCYIKGDLENCEIETFINKEEIVKLEKENYLKAEIKNFIAFCSSNNKVSNNLIQANEILKMSKK